MNRLRIKEQRNLFLGGTGNAMAYLIVKGEIEMENKNEKLQELDPEQMEQVSGGFGGTGGAERPVVCTKCRQVFMTGKAFLDHLPTCPGQTPRVTVMA